MVYEQPEHGTAPDESVEVLRLFRSGPLEAHSRNTWTASLFDFNRFFRANTSYVFVLECVSGCSGENSVKLRLTSSRDEDATSQAGWSLGDRVQHKIFEIWQTHPKRHSLVLDIKGAFARKPYVKHVRVTSVPKATATRDTYAVGELIEFSVHYSEPMSVTGTPGLQFDLGGATRTAWYVGGDTSGNLRFAYTVAAGDVDRNGISIGSSDETWTDVGTITSVATGRHAQLYHEALGTQTEHKVDADIDRPAITSVALASTPLVATTYGRGEAIEIKTTFDRPVSVSGTPAARIEIGPGVRRASYVTGSDTDTLVFEYVVQQSDVDGNGISIPEDALAFDEPARGSSRALIWDTATSAVVNTDSDAITDAAGHRVNGALNRHGQSTLRHLDVQGVTLTPTFAPNVHQYTATTATGAEVTVDARATIAEATVDIDPDDADGIQSGHQVALLGGGTRTIAVTVTAVDESKTTYTINLSHTGVVPGRVAPPVLRVGSDRERKVEVRWTQPNDHGNPITRYDVRLREVEEPSWSNRSLGRTDRTTTFVNLRTDGHYEVQVRAANFVGSGPWSKIATAQVSPPPPDAPDAPTVTTASKGGLEVSWTAPPDHGRDIKDYNMQFRVTGETNWELSEHTIGRRTSMTLSGLRSGTGYEVQVRAISLSGRSPWSPTGAGETATEPCAERDDDWCTTLTVAVRTTSDGTQTGARANGFGTIADSTIDHAGTTYIVDGIWLWRGSDNSRTAIVEFQGVEPPHGSTFDLGGATLVTGPDSEDPNVAKRHTWAGPAGLDWREGQKVTVSARIQRANDDATLRGLALSTGDGHAITFDPAFDPATGTYTTDVAHTVDTMTVEPMTAYLGAEVEYLDAHGTPATDAEAGEPGFQYRLSKGANTLEIRVTAGDRITTGTYTITVTRSDAAAIAPGNEEGTPRALRLVDDEGEVQYGSETAEGRLEFFHAGRWGTVCSDRFRETYDNDDPLPETNIVPRNFAPALACKQLGYANGEYASGWGQPGLPHKRPGPDDTYTEWQPIWLDDLRCSVGSTHWTGDYPNRIDQCNFSGLSVRAHNCTHADDAGIRCYGGRTATTLASQSDGVEHDGVAPASVSLAFHVREGDPIGTSEQDFTDHAMIAQGTESVRATRSSTDANRWTLSLTPSGYADMRVVIPAYRSCHEPGAICTGSHNPLSETIVIDVPYGERSRQVLALTGRFRHIPASHDGSTGFIVEFVFSTPVRNTAEDLRDNAIQIGGGTIRSVQSIDGGNARWRIGILPDGSDDVTVTVKAGGACGEPGVPCTAGGETVAETVSATIEGPGGPAPLTVRFDNAPATHGGRQNFRLDAVFSEAPAGMNNLDILAAVNVSGGTKVKVRTVGGDRAHRRIWITPDGRGAVTVSFPPTLDCNDTNAICSDSGGKLEGLAAIQIAGPAMVDPSVPLTVRFENVPEEHDGSAQFKLEAIFNHPPAGKDNLGILAALEVTNGTKKKSRRIDGDRAQRRIWVEPDGTGAVTLGFGATTDCAAANALCTEGGGKLETRVSTTIPGPVAISVADARVEEGPNAALEFAVTLDRARHQEVRVDYATEDGTAAAGDDYTGTAGTLVFAAGETAKTVTVRVLDDAHDEGEETMRLRLSNPSGARISDRVGEGTISNTDHMPQAWLARFGRTVADQVIDAVETRMRAPRAPGAEVRLAGQRLGLGPLFGADAAPDGGAAGRESEAEALEGERRLAAWLGGGADDAERGGLQTRPMTQRELLLGSAFSLTAAAGEGTGETVSLWGRTAVSRFDGREADLALDGEVASGLLGADWARERWTAGLVVSHSRGEGGYHGESGAGTVSSTLTGLYPWGRHALNERVSVRGVAGYGEGTLTLTPEGADGEAQAALRTDMDLLLGAAGVRGVAVQAPAAGGFELAVTSDALGVRTSTAAVSGGGGHLAASQAEVTRLRLGLEGAWKGLVVGTGTLTPRLELGARHDGGDAETGFGLDVGGGLAWWDPARGVSAELHGRGLLTHESAGFGERGLAGSFAWDPAPDSDRGASVTLTQTVGASATGGTDALLGPESAQALGAANDDGLARRRLEAKLGYGFAVLGGAWTGTPELGLGWSESVRETVLGWRLAEARGAGLVFGLDVEGARREAVGGDGEPVHRLGLGLGWRLAGAGRERFEVRFEGARLAPANDDGETRLGVTLSARW